MTTIAKDVTVKVAGAALAVAMLFSVAAPAANAQTTVADLEAQIAALLAQLNALGGTTTTTDSSSAVCPYTWTRNLNIGATGADVMKLQQFLNEDADTMVAMSGVGSKGMETSYYGAATAAAVSKFQVKYRTEVLSPVSLVNPTGYFGPSSRTKANSMLAAMCSTTVVDNSGDTTTTVVTSSALSGEASLDMFDMNSADDDEIQEGASDAVVAEVDIEFTDGDAELSRMDIALMGVEDAWDVFESVSIWVDGTKVAEENADDEDDYLDEDAGEIRFSNLGLIFSEDDEKTIVIAASVQNNVDAADLGAYTVEVSEIRYFDADDVATTDSASYEIGNTVSFEIEEAGQDDEIIVRTSSNDPDADTLQVEDDSKSDWYSVFAFDVDTDDSENDIVLDKMSVDVTTTIANYDVLVDDAELVIDGTVIDDFTVSPAGGATTTVTLEFDVDEDVEIDAGDRVEAELRLRFKSLDAANAGATVMAEVTSANVTAIDAEGSDDLDATQLSGSASGEAHTLLVEGLDLDMPTITATEMTKDVSGSDLDFGKFVFEFDVTAFEEEFFTDEDAAVVTYTVIVDGVDDAAATAAASAALDINTNNDGTTAEKRLAEGQSVEYTLTVETDTSISGTVEVRVDSVAYSAADDATEELTVTANPANDWTSGQLILN